MNIAVVVTIVVALVISGVLTGIVRKLALSRGMLDRPNGRSSHTVPTPRGGGIAAVLSTTVSLTILTMLGMLPADAFIALCGGGLAVAIVGFLDDRHVLSAKIRLAVHFAAAVWALSWLGGLPPLQIGDHLVSFGWAGYVLGSFAIVWTLNLFNFMDGIDGIAASEAIFIASAAALISFLSNTSSIMVPAALVFAAACGGFLMWNWPPARIFMGDVGSGYLGYVIATLALAAARENPIGLLVWLILGGVFFVDATVTLMRRLVRRERVYEAHRSHAYQWLAHRWGGHLRVTVAVLAVDVVLLFPCAMLAVLYPRLAAYILLAVLMALTLLATLIGAGRSTNAGNR